MIGRSPAQPLLIPNPAGSALERLTANAPLYVIPGPAPGLVRPGNVDLRTRPRVRNADGSYSTVKSISFSIGNHEVLLPQVIQVNGRWIVGTPRQALQHYVRTGQHLGIFNSVQAANTYAERLHAQQARAYGQP